MKKSVIKDIFYGERGYRELIKPPRRNADNLDRICQLEDKLKNELTPQQFVLHEKFIKAIEENCCNEVDYYFVEGFKLGLLIGIETMEDN